MNDNYPFVICKLRIILNGGNGKNGRLEGGVYKTCTKSRRNSKRIHLCPSLRSTLPYAKSIRAPRPCTQTFYTNLRCVDYPVARLICPGYRLLLFARICRVEKLVRLHLPTAIKEPKCIGRSVRAVGLLWDLVLIQLLRHPFGHLHWR